MGRRRQSVTIKHVAADAGVSLQTVSRVINNEPNVRPEMKDRVQASIDKLVQIQKYHTEVFATFVDRLAKAKEAEGTILDHSTILFGSNMSNSDKHNNDPLPAAILGHANGKIKGGQHVKYPQDSRFADLLVTLFDRNNIPVEKLGDSGGILSEV